MTDVNVGLVIKRHPDGYNYVPFDHDPHPERQMYVDAYIAALIKEGHKVEMVPTEGGSFHLKLHSGPRA